MNYWLLVTFLHWELCFYRMKIYPPGLIQIALMKEMKMIGVIGEEICLVLFVFFALLITQIFPKYSITWTLYMNSTMENSNQVSAWTFTSKSRCGHVRKRWLIFISTNENYFKTCLQGWDLLLKFENLNKYNLASFRTSRFPISQKNSQVLSFWLDSSAKIKMLLGIIQNLQIPYFTKKIVKYILSDWTLVVKSKCS